MPYNPNIHKRRSIRLPEYDYAQEGAYFVTICTHHREHLFGEIQNGRMILSPVGAIADVLWYEIKTHFENIDLGEFVVMPNHIHGIIIINEIPVRATHALPDDNNTLALSDDTGTRHALSVRGDTRFQNQGKRTLSSIIGSYKSAVSRHAHRLGFSFAWQRNYYEHIIRNEKSFRTISEYIQLNPQKWSDDRFYTK